MSTRLEKLMKVVHEANSDLATYSDVKAIIDSFVKVVTDTKRELGDNMANNKAEMSIEVKKAVDSLPALETRLTTLAKDLDGKQTISLSTAVKQLQKEIKSLEASLFDEINKTDDFDEIEKRVNSLADLLTSENIRNMLELLEGDERLKASAISGLDDFFKRFEQLNKTVKGLKGAASVPSPMHVPTFEKFTMDGVATSVTLQHAVGAAGHAIFNVTYQGQVIHRDEHYTVNGNKITFVGFTPGNAKIITVTYMP